MRNLSREVTTATLINLYTRFISRMFSCYKHILQTSCESSVASLRLQLLQLPWMQVLTKICPDYYRWIGGCNAWIFWYSDHRYMSATRNSPPFFVVISNFFWSLTDFFFFFFNVLKNAANFSHNFNIFSKTSLKLPGIFPKIFSRFSNFRKHFANTVATFPYLKRDKIFLNFYRNLLQTYFLSLTQNYRKISKKSLQISTKLSSKVLSDFN